MATTRKTTTKKTEAKKKPSRISSRVKMVEQREVVINLPSVKVPKVLHRFQGFVDFVRQQGVVGLAVGLVIGTQVKTLVDQLVASFINPLLGLLLPGTGSLADKKFYATFNGKSQDFLWGAFVSQLISFLVVVAALYFLVKSLKLDKLDKKKD